MRKISAASALNGQANAQKNRGEKDVALQSEVNERRPSSNAEESESTSGKADGHNSTSEEQEIPEEELARVSLISGKTENDSETRL